MTTMDSRFSFAHVRNRAEQCHLDAELYRMEKEKQIELRTLKAEKQKFRSKYSKQVTASEPSEVKMFVTHTPGFCYRCNGEQKNVEKVSFSPTIDFKHLHSLIFTNGEVDIEKILCLHLVSAHRAETLTPPRRKARYLCKEHSPTERLIDRSKRGFNDFEKVSHLLPLYTVELSEYRAMGELTAPLINDGRLAARILINDKVRELINTVVIGLEHSNHSKLKHLVSLAKDTTSLRRMLGKRSVADFLETLYDHSLINSCESYVLTPPFRIKTRDLDIKTVSGNIENLIKHIRQNVLQPPSCNIWKAKVKAQKELDAILQVQSVPSSNAKTERGQVTNTQSNTSKGSAKFEMHARRDSSRRLTEEDEEKEIVPRGHINYIAKNIEAAGKAKRIEYDTDEDEYLMPRKMSTVSNRSKKRSLRPKANLQNFLPTTESVQKEKSVGEDISIETSQVMSPSESLTSDTRSANRRPSHDLGHQHIKHTTCLACMEKWKTPLPSPKTPRVKQSAVLPNPDKPLKTNLHNRISMLINKEMYRLESYDRKFSAESESSKKFSLKKNKEPEPDPLDNVNLNPMDLAKIEQEIKEKETQKKLEKFMRD